MRFVCESCRAQYMINDEKVGPKGVKVRCRKCGYVILVKKTEALGSSPEGDANATQVLENPLLKPASTEAARTQAEDHTALGGVDDNEEKTRVGTAVPSWTKSDGKDSFLGAGEDEIGAVFDQVLSTGPTAIPKSVVEASQTKVPTGDDSDANGGEGDGEGEGSRDSTRVIDVDLIKKLAEQSGDAPKKAEASAEPAAEEVPTTDWYVALNEKQTGPLTLDAVKQHWDHGEIGPDSLCWRSGFSDWVPVSSVKNLAGVLAPRPAKPLVVVPAPVENVGAVVNMPVQSAFSAGGMMQTVQSSVQVPLGIPSGAMGVREETSTWRPSAASALASLVQDEMAALSKPAPRESVPPAALNVSASIPGLLDVPAEEERAPVIAAEPARAAAAAPAPVNPYLANPGATYSAPALTSYRPPSNRNLIIAIAGIASLFGVVLLGVIIWLATRQPQVIVQAPTQPPPVAVAPAQPAPVAVAPTPAPANPTPAPVAANPAPAAEAGTVPANPPVAVAAANPNPPAATPEPVKVAKRDPVVRAPVANRPAKEEPKAVAAVEEKPTPPPRPGSAEDDFASAFGIPAKSAKKEAAPEPEKKKSGGYIPPPPGGGGDMKESLGQSDIMEVVLANKPALAKCVADQKSRDPGTSGKLLMRWSIQTSGKTSNIGVASDEFKGTYIAGCIGGLIKGWAFPRHKVAGEPVTFPFKF